MAEKMVRGTATDASLVLGYILDNASDRLRYLVVAPTSYQILLGGFRCSIDTAYTDKGTTEGAPLGDIIHDHPGASACCFVLISARKLP